jgi:hypothetical protein
MGCLGDRVHRFSDFGAHFRRQKKTGNDTGELFLSPIEVIVTIEQDGVRVDGLVHDEGLDDIGQHHPGRVEQKLFQVRIRDFVVREHPRHSHQRGGADERGTGFIDTREGTQAMIDLNHDLPPPGDLDCAGIVKRMGEPAPDSSPLRKGLRHISNREIAGCNQNEKSNTDRTFAAAANFRSVRSKEDVGSFRAKRKTRRLGRVLVRLIEPFGLFAAMSFGKNCGASLFRPRK